MIVAWLTSEDRDRRMHEPWSSAQYVIVLHVSPSRITQFYHFTDSSNDAQ